MDINKKTCFAQGIAHLLLFQTAHGNMDVEDNYLTPDRFPLGEFVNEVFYKPNDEQFASPLPASNYQQYPQQYYTLV